MKQRLPVAIELVQVQSINTNVFAFIILQQLRTFLDKLIWSYAYIIACLQDMAHHELGVDVEMIGTAHIIDAIRSSCSHHAGVMTGNLGMGQYHSVVGHTPNSDFILSQPDWTNWR